MTSDPGTAGGSVREEPAGSRFVFEADGEVAELVYDDVAPGRLVLVHTGVPESLGGRGIGGLLVAAALARAAAEHRTVVPVCPFARRWLEGHPDAAQGVEIDWTAES